jgi:hypothetical protein
VAVAVSQRLVAHTRPRPDHTPDQLNKYAGQLNNLSVRLGELGRREEGLAAVEEAATVYRRPAEANPAVLPARPGDVVEELVEAARGAGSARRGERHRRQVNIFEPLI